LPKFGQIILADTVGFIRHLPHELIEAFRATLEETKDAELLLHIIDASDSLHKDKIQEVNAVLEQIGAQDVTQLQVYNKIDLIADAVPRIDYSATQKPWRVWVSAKEKLGVQELFMVLRQMLEKKA